MGNLVMATAGDLLRKKYWSTGRFRYLLMQFVTSTAYRALNDFVLKNSFFTESWYAPWIVVGKNEAFIDIGANVGFYSSRLSRRAGLVISFEPNPITYGKLCRKVSGLRNVLCYQYAIGNKNETLPLFLFDQEAGSSIRRKSNKFELVKCVRLDDILSKLPLRGMRVGLLKIDVEGAEYEVLEGARQLLSASKPTILLEIFGDANLPACKELLQSCGYQMRLLKRYVEWGQWWFVAQPIKSELES